MTWSRLARLALVPAAALVASMLAGPAAAAGDSGAFVVRLGSDTVSVERYTRTPERVIVDQLGRSPRVMRRHFVYDYDHGALSHLSMVVTPPGATAPTQTVDVTADHDSLRISTKSGDGPARLSSVGVPRGALIQPLSSLWTGYETEIMKLVAGKADSLHGTQWYLGGGPPWWFGLHKLGTDSVAVYNEQGTVFHAGVDRAGRVIGMLPIAGTGKFSVDRLASIDLDAMTASFAAREQASGAMGALSPRDTLRVDAGGASLWFDYGRPGKRGRTIFGDVVPYGAIWRTGANAATQFKTDKSLNLSGTVVPAGFYTLWTIPSPDGWKLVFNGETGQWGTEHKAERDLYTVPMKTSVPSETVERFTISVVPSEQGGTLTLDWDTTRASANFTVGP